MLGRKVLAALTLLALLAPLASSGVKAAGNPTITKFSVTPDKPGYAIGETPNLIVTITYENFNNTQVKVAIYNESDELVQEISGITLDGNDTYQQTHQLNINLTKAGSYSYKAKLIDINTGYILKEDSFTINVYERQLSIVISWNDVTGDRKVDLNEEVTFKVFITWSYWNVSESLDVFIVIDSSNEIPLGSISITNAAGSQELQYSTSFSQAGSHSVKVIVRNAENEIVSSKMININVGKTQASTYFFGIPIEWILFGLIIVVAIVVSALIVKKL